jgi:hypothetical protein
MQDYWNDLESRAAINLICALDAEIVAKQQTILMCCDKDFPEIFRQKIWDSINNLSLETGSGRIQENIDSYNQTKRSLLLDSLKNIWQEIASKNYPTRFGMLLGDPATNLAARDSYNKEMEEFDLKERGETK